MRFEQKFRQDLSPLLRQAYDAACSSMGKFERSFVLPLSREEDMWPVLQAVLFDHPEIFWYKVTEFQWRRVASGYQVILDFLMPMGEIRMHKAALDATLVKEFHKLRFYDEFRKVNYVHNYFMEHVTYEKDLPHDYNLFGPLFKGRGCCQGIAAAFVLIMNYLDVPCFMEVGQLKSEDSYEGHAWVAVKVLGHWTYCDPTNDLDGMRSFLCVGEKDLEGVYLIDKKCRRYDFSNRELGYHSYNHLEFASVKDAVVAAHDKLRNSGDEFRCKLLLLDGKNHGDEIVSGLFAYADVSYRVEYLYRLNMQTYVFKRLS